MEKNNKNCKHHGQNIAFWRNFNKWTQAQFGEMVGLSQNQISELERKEEIDEETLIKMAHSLMVDVDQLKSCNHEGTIAACRSIINYIYNVQNGGSLVQGDHIINNPLDVVTQLHKEVIKLMEEKVAKLEAEIECMKKGGK